MKIIYALLISIILTLTQSSANKSKGWRGVVPLHSTRTDVERLLGKPNAEYGRYDFKEEKAVIFYAEHPCSAGAQWNVPPDTVTSISIYPKKSLRLIDLRLDPNKYKKVGDSYSQGRTVYWNEEEGIQYAVFEGVGSANGKVLEIYYQPSARDRHLRCPDPAPSAIKTECSQEERAHSRLLGGDPCPEILISGPKGDQCESQRYFFSASLAGLDARANPTFRWKVSAGAIVGGQSTSAIEVDASAAGGKPITVEVEVCGAIPDGCQNKESYTTECPGRPGAAPPNNGMHPTADTPPLIFRQ